jgi:tRNA (adenine37-N6)-methyltransferase
MLKEEICFKPIGVIHTPYKRPEDAPRRPCRFPPARAWVEVFAPYRRGLKDLRGFSHVLLVYHLHLSKGYQLVCKPFLDNTHRGVFATRSPRRPNPIGISVVRLVRIRRGVLEVSHVDMVDGSPLLDIKPYVPEVARNERVKLGWLEAALPRLSSRTKRNRKRMRPTCSSKSSRRPRPSSKSSPNARSH